MNQYEIVLLIRNQLSEEQLKASKEKVFNILKEHQGQIIEVNEAGERELAYEIDHENKAYYVIFLAKCLPRGIFELKREVVINKNFLRVFVMNTDKNPFYVKNLQINSLKVDDESFARVTNNRYFIKKLYYRRALEKRQQEEAAGNAVNNDATPVSNENATTSTDK